MWPSLIPGWAQRKLASELQQKGSPEPSKLYSGLSKISAFAVLNFRATPTTWWLSLEIQESWDWGSRETYKWSVSSKGDFFLWFSVGAEALTSKIYFALGEKTYPPRNVFRRDEAVWLRCCAHGKGSQEQSKTAALVEDEAFVRHWKKMISWWFWMPWLAPHRTCGVTWGKSF